MTENVFVFTLLKKVAHSSSWNSIFKTTNWTPRQGEWIGNVLYSVIYEGSSYLTLSINGNWAKLFRPSKIRVTHSFPGGIRFQVMAGLTSGSSVGIALDTNYESQEVLDLTFQGFDLQGLRFVKSSSLVIYSVSNIEFFY